MKVGFNTNNYTNINLPKIQNKQTSVSFGQSVEEDTFNGKKVLKTLGIIGATSALIGATFIFVKKGKFNFNKKPINNFSGKNNLEYFKTKLGALKDGKAILKNGESFTGELEHINSKGEKFILDYKEGNLMSSTKKSIGGSIEQIKKYSKDNKFNACEIFSVDKTGSEKLVSKTVKTPDSIRRYGADEELESWFQKINESWKKVDFKVNKKEYTPWDTFSLEEFYLQKGRQVNDFLRTGEFTNYGLPDNKIPDIIPETWNSTALERVEEAKKDNRTILEMIDKMDKAVHSSKTGGEITVYRRAPYSWLNSAKDGILEDSGYCSTSLDKNAYWGHLCDTRTKNNPQYKIILPEGTPFYNLSYTDEQEILLPRNSIFKDLGNMTLIYLGEKQ